jgi:Uma2 family endonuclease
MMPTESSVLTLEEYAALDEPEEEYVTELVRGVLVREPRPSHRHGVLQVELAFRLRSWAERRGAWISVESGFVLGGDPPTLRGPDVAVVLDPEQAERDEHGWLSGAPDVAVEVLSPSETSTAVHRKTMDYLEAGARLVWLVDAEARTVMIHRPDGSANLLREGETLSGEDVLAGFSLALRDLFRES